MVQQGFFDPPSEFIAEIQDSVLDTASRAIEELEGQFRRVVQLPAGLVAGTREGQVVGARDFLQEPVKQAFIEARRAADELRVLALEPLAESVDRVLNELATIFFPPSRLNG
jgi:hypothetical protein